MRVEIGARGRHLKSMKGDLPGSNLELFSAQTRASAAPPGFRYGANLVEPDEESALVAEIEALHLTPYEFRGIAARRRVISFGPTPGYRSHPPAEALVMPPFLHRLRARAAVFAGRSADEFAQALVTEYSPGTPIGWHTTGSSSVCPCCPPRLCASGGRPVPAGRATRKF